MTKEPLPQPSLRTRLAFAFSADLTMEEMKSRLQAAGPWVWSNGDSDRYGDYLGTRAVPHDGVLRIYKADPPGGRRYSINLRYDSARPADDAVHDLQALKTRVLSALLPSLGARDVVPAEPND